MDSIKQDDLISSFVTLQEASREVGKITNFYKNDDIDLTILLTHIGFESDVELAKLLKPEWGVDIIIGGHSHTILTKPAMINNILIVQAGVGTDQIGRLDIVVDDETNSVVEYKWQLIPIDNKLAEPDLELQVYISSFQDVIERKYNTLVCKLAQVHTHPKREIETALGNLIADAFAEIAECDVMLVGSGSIRVNQLGPLVTRRDLLNCFPFDDTISRYFVSGVELRRIFNHFMRPENRNSEGECYQVNSKIKALYNDSNYRLVSLKINNNEIEDKELYSLCIQGYHFNNAKSYLNMTQEELLESGRNKVISTSAKEVLEEYLRNRQNLKVKVEGRLQYL